MNLFNVAGALIAAAIVIGANEAQAQTNCNSAGARCVVATNWDSNGNVETCLDISSPSTSCTRQCYLTDGQYGPCVAWTTNYNASCMGFWNCGARKTAETATASTTTEDRSCGTNGAYCGWRGSVNKSSGGVNNNARAKLHACAVNGSADEQYYSSSNSACQSYASDTSINGFCDATVWSTLCSNAGF